MADTKVTLGVPLFVVGALVLLWTSVGQQSETMMLGAGFIAAVILTAGTILLGFSGGDDGRIV